MINTLLLLLYCSLSVTHSFSIDRKIITFEGNEPLNRSYYEYTGSYWTYTKIIVENGITELGSSCFSSSSLVEEIKLPSSCQKIGSHCFYKCSRLTNIIIPEGVKNIYSNTFQDCGSLKNITFPSTLRYIDNDYTFASCNQLEKFIVSNNTNFSTTFSGKILIYNNDIAISCAGAFSELTIPSSIRLISKNFAQWKGKIKTFVFEEASMLKTIQTEAFSSTTTLTTIELPDGINSIEGSPFMSTSIHNLNLPKSLTEISDTIFKGMSKLEKVSVAPGCQAVVVDDEMTIFNKGKTTILFMQKTAPRLKIPLSIESINLELLRRP